MFAQAIVPSLPMGVQLAVGDEGVQLVLQVVVALVVFQTVETVQVGGRRLRIGKVSDEFADVGHGIRRVWVGGSAVRVVVMQVEGGVGLFGSEMVRGNQPLACLLVAGLGQGDDMAAAEDGCFHGAAVGGAEDEAAVRRRFFQGLEQGVQRVGIVVVDSAKVDKALATDGGGGLYGVADGADIFNFARLVVARRIGMGALREQVTTFAVTTGAGGRFEAEGTPNDGVCHVVSVTALRVKQEEGGGQIVGQAVQAAIVQVSPG